MVPFIFTSDLIFEGYDLRKVTMDSFFFFPSTNRKSVLVTFCNTGATYNYISCYFELCTQSPGLNPTAKP